jgi:hypothetical protein
VKGVGEPCAGEPHARFDGRGLETERTSVTAPAPDPTILRPIVPDKVAWLASQMLKTRVAHGYCSRHEGQGACEYANICETCDNYTPATEFAAALTDQLADIQVLQADADHRGWTSEAQRHDRVAKALQSHLDRLP